MPDPPQNIIEELTYTIRHHDLKPAYRDSGSQLMQQYCSEVETKTSISIQMQWKADEVEFNITGLEEGVATALEELQVLKGADEAVTLFQQSPIPLTEAALQAHDEQMSTEVRQFSCRGCYRYWYRVVPSHKPVSKCQQCGKKYNAVCDNEFITRHYTCSNRACGDVFYGPQEMTTCPCCGARVVRQYIHCEPHIQKFLLLEFNNFSTPHISTGSTVETWLSQTAVTYNPPVHSGVSGNAAQNSHASLPMEHPNRVQSSSLFMSLDLSGVPAFPSLSRYSSAPSSPILQRPSVQSSPPLSQHSRGYASSHGSGYSGGSVRSYGSGCSRHFAP